MCIDAVHTAACILSKIAFFLPESHSPALCEVDSGKIGLKFSNSPESLSGDTGGKKDFFGPGSKNSVFYVSMLERMLKGKGPQAIAPKGVKHTYAYTMDAGRAMVMLAMDESTYGQVWHLPVGGGLAAEEIAALMNKELGTDYKISFLPGFMLKLLGLFMRPLRELNEMMYQFRQPYDMSWQKFKNHFPEFEVTPYDVALRETVKSFR